MAIEIKKSKRLKHNTPNDATNGKKAAKPRKKHVPDPMALWRLADELAAKLTPEEVDQVPHDGSINYRHYLYGHPKRES